jgi:hypothetical protein
MLARVTALGSAIATVAIALVPDVTQFPNDLSTWLFRGVLLTSLAFNLHFLRKIYLKIGHIDKVRQQIKTIITALEYLAKQASKSPERRESDILILQLLDDLKDKRTQISGE